MAKITANVSYTVRYAANDGFEALDTRRRLGRGESSAALDYLGEVTVTVPEDAARRLFQLEVLKLDSKMCLERGRVYIPSALELPAERLAEVPSEDEAKAEFLGRVWAEVMERRALVEIADRERRVAEKAASEEKYQEDLAARQRAEDEEKATQARRLIQLAKLVRPLASEAQRELLDARPSTPLGLLSVSAAIEIVENHYLPLDPQWGLFQYTMLEEFDLDRGEGGDDCRYEHPNVSFQTLKVSELTSVNEALWVRLKKIQQHLAEAGLAGVLLLHKARCACGTEEWRPSVKVTKDLGECLVIDREYGE